MYSVLSQISKMYTTFTPVERRIADIMMEQPEKVVNLPIKDIAALADTSEAAIVRFSKRLGLSGIKVVKVELARELHTIDVEKVSSKIELTDDTETLKEKVFNNTIQALYNTEKISDTECIEQAADKILNAKRMVIFGIGGSSLVGSDLKMKLARIDMYAEYTSDNHAAMTAVANCEEGDVLFVISTSGRTKEIIEVIKYAKTRHMSVILLTQKMASPAQRLAEITLTISKEENNIRFATMTARIAQLAIIDLLFLTICSRKGDDVLKRILNTYEAVQIAKEDKDA